MEERENLNFFLTLNLLGFVLFPAVRARLIFSKLHTCEKIVIPTVYKGGGGGNWERWGGWQMREMGRVADGRDGEGSRWE